MKLLEHFTSIDDTNLGLMILYKGCQKLDNESTLSECNVRLGDTLFLRVLHDSGDPGKYSGYELSNVRITNITFRNRCRGFATCRRIFRFVIEKKFISY